MKNLLTAPLAVFAAAAPAWAETPEKFNVFEGDTGGYKAYRIPAPAMTPRGTLLAFCASRKELGDRADIDIALRRSTDGGKTWEPMLITAERGTMTVDNPMRIVGRQTGAVDFLFQVTAGTI
jgi:sialidase-1